MEWIDIGDGHAYHFTEWHPDMSIPQNAGQYAHLALLIKQHPIVGAVVRHECSRTETGLHEGAIFFETPLTDAGPFKDHARWKVLTWKPLHIEPSLQSHCPCRDHGFIRGDKWERA